MPFIDEVEVHAVSEAKPVSGSEPRPQTGKDDSSDQPRLPSVDRVLRDPALDGVIGEWGLKSVKLAVRSLQSEYRADEPRPAGAETPAHYATASTNWLRDHIGHGYESVFNLTGTVIHTNLGRSLIGPDVLAEALRVASRPVTLEYDLRTGKRGKRDTTVIHRLKLLTGAEAATVVNNNAAALLIVLNTLADGRDVPVSRGELIEIGGSFRLPEIMARAGCRLVEIGTTNRTHAKDYAAAAAEAALLLKVHPSNFHIEGFTKEVSTTELAQIGRDADVPVVVDVGSGTLVDLQRFGLPHEPMPSELLAQGADLVTFSGDKLLGGVQAGIVVGRQDLIDAIDRNPLKRALRLDKVTLALLDATLKVYEDDEQLLDQLPLLATLTLSLDVLDARATRLAQTLSTHVDARVDVRQCFTQLGSGALPGQRLESRAVVAQFDRDRDARALERRLRNLATPVIGRIHDGAVWLDVRGAEPLDELIETVAAL